MIGSFFFFLFTKLIHVNVIHVTITNSLLCFQGMNHALPNVISPFLQNFNNDEREEQLISAERKLQTTTVVTTAVTPLPAERPILLSRIAPSVKRDEEKRTRMQVENFTKTKYNIQILKFLVKGNI